MNCPLQRNEGAELVLDYCAGRLEPGRAATFELHVAGCADCRQVVDAQRAVWNALDEYQAADISPDFDRKLWARIDAEDRKSLWQRLLDGPAMGWSTIWNWKPAAAAAACASVLAVGLFVNQDRGGALPSASGSGASQSQSQQVADKSLDRPVDVEQVESAVEDLEMLNQLGVVGGDRSAI